MKKHWYCDGVAENWMTTEGEDGWERTVRDYKDDTRGGPYYLASDVRDLANLVYPYVYEQSSGERTPKETADLLDLLERLTLQSPASDP